VAMAAEQNVAVVAVDPAYTSRWGAQHWQQPLAGSNRTVSRHDAACIAIGRRALGYPVRRRTAPPPHDRRDRAGHRTAQVAAETRGREGSRPRIPGARTSSVPPGSGANAGDQHAQHRSEHATEHQQSWKQDSLPLSHRLGTHQAETTSAGRPQTHFRAHRVSPTGDRTTQSLGTVRVRHSGAERPRPRAVSAASRV
jgi:hypothetical protein